MPTTVPKFGSFRGVKPSLSRPEASRPASKDSKAEQPDLVRHQSRHRHDPRPTSATVPTPKDGGVRQLTDRATALYTIDTRGDSYNLVYGTNDSAKVPLYHLTSGGRVLGSSTRRIEPSRRSRLSDLTTEERLRLHATGTIMDDSQSSTNTTRSHLDIYADFVPLGSTRKRKRGESKPPPGPAAGLLQASPSDDPSSDSGSEEVEVQGFKDSTACIAQLASTPTIGRLQQRNLDLQKARKDKPTNLCHWEALINFQDEWSQANFPDGQQTAAIAIANLKLSLYRDALRVVSSTDPGLENFLISMMQVACLAWPVERVASEWSGLLAAHGNFLKLHLEYATFVQHVADDFNVDGVKAIWLAFFEKSVNFVSHASGETLTLHGLARYMSFLRDHGHPELSVAVLQAQLESCLSSPAYELEFDEYWEDEEPRIGEGHLPLQPEIDLQASTYHLGQWIRQERLCAEVNRFPGKGIENSVSHELMDAGDDPYHVVFADDLKPFPMPFRGIKAHDALIDIMLQYLGYPSISSHSRSDEILPWRSDACCQVAPSGATVADLSSLTSHSNSINSLALFADPSSALSLFNSKNWNLQPENNFARNALYRLYLDRPRNDSIAEYCLALELCFDPKEARKLAKCMLKATPSSLRLYNAYAHIEYRLGNPERAIEVLIASIKRFTTSSAGQRLHLLWATLVYMSLHHDSAAVTLQRLHLFHDLQLDPVKSTTNASILRVEREILKARDMALSTKDFLAAARHSFLLAALTYCSSDQNLANAVNTFQSSSKMLELHTSSHNNPHIELLHEYKVILVDHHTSSKRSYQQSLLRDTLSESISLFPDNTLFASLYAGHASSFALEDRVRSVIRSNEHSTQEPSTDSFIQHALRIKAELRRAETSGLTTATPIRRAFEKAASSAVAKHAPWIWMCWLAWEAEVGREAISQATRSAKQESSSRVQKVVVKEMQRAKDVFRRGLIAIPWVKAFVMLGLDVLDEALSRNEVVEIRDLIEMRGYRVFMDMAGIEEGRD